MRYTEEELWKLTPRKFKSQLDIHEEIQRKMAGGKGNKKGKGMAPMAFIDQIKGW